MLFYSLEIKLIKFILTPIISQKNRIGLNGNKIENINFKDVVLVTSYVQL